MKRVPKNYYVLVLLCSLLASCSVYNFSNPQPDGLPDLTEFPSLLLGTWYQDSFTTSFEMDIPIQEQGGYLAPTDPEEKTEYVIQKKYFSIISSNQTRVVKGAWPKTGGNNTYIYPGESTGNYEFMQTINYDSLHRVLDTTDNYIILQKKIYNKTQEGFLGKGYHYFEDHDTLVIIRNDTLHVDLGRNAFLRKLSDSLYTLNILKYVLGSEEDQNWWMVILLELNTKGQLMQWEISGKSTALSCMIYQRNSKNDYLYFDCNWTAAELLQMKKEGYWEPVGNFTKKQR